MRWRIILTWACAGALSLSLARGEQTLQQRYLDIYLKINDAEHLEKQEDFRGALDDFKDCYSKLSRIHETDPNWESALVVHRMEDCKAKILELQPKADAQPLPTPATPATVDNSTNAAPTPASPATSDDVAALKLQLQAVKEELQVTKDHLRDSQAMVETYRVQLETVNQQLATLKNQQSVDDRVGKLLSDNKALSDKLAIAQKEIQTYKSSPRGKLALAQAQLKNLQDQYAASQESNKALQDTTTTLRQQLDQAQADLVAANQKLAAAPVASPEYETLKRENEIMRGILTRELQEQAHRDMAKRLFEEEYDNLKLKSKVLQEQVDILASPMTPPTNEEERTLLASLKIPAPDVANPNANTFTAPAPGPASGTTDSTTVATGTAPTTPSAPDTSTNMAPVAVTTPETNSVVAITAPASTNSPASTPSTADAATNQPDVSIVGNGPAAPVVSAPTNASPMNVTGAAPATNTVATSNPPPSAPAASTTLTDPTTPPTTVASTPPADTVPAVTPAPTNTPASPSAPSEAASAPATNAAPADVATVTKLPPAQTVYTDQTIQNNGTTSAPKPPDPTQYSTKARLPDDMRDTAQDAADLFKNQRYDDAAAKYQSIIDKYPESLYAWSNLGVVRFQQGKYEEALKALQQAVKLSPTDAFSYSNLGIVYYQLNQYENAIDALNSAMALDPNDPKTRNYLGCACSQKGWQEVAEKQFRKAIEIDPNFGDAHFNLALVYATSKPPSLELARREYNRALELGIGKDPRLEKLLGTDSTPTADSTTTR